MAESLDELAAALEAAVAGIEKKEGDCGCKGKGTEMNGFAFDLGSDAGPVPPLAQMEQDLDAAIEDAFLGTGEPDFGAPEGAEGGSLDQLLGLLQQYPGLKITLGY
jgi:hypothetical protein